MDLKKVHNKANAVMNDRRSIREYDTSVKIERDKMRNIIQDAMTAPSSFNMQPWRFVVVDTPEGKAKTKPYMMFNQRQNDTSSALIVIYADMQNQDMIDSILATDVKLGLREEDNMEKMATMIKDYRARYSPERLAESQVLDCGFVIMQLMLSAKAYGYDTNAIGGFDRENISKVLGMDTNRYKPVLILSIGKANQEGHDSSRLSVDEVTKWI
ncbi:nitroreductase family protein [Dysgonomonas massiliensis]|uniref:nitroreductase family protein n=1 Tax=Dysgonomonas massiliensis TaxID=2040292 RepID=UPI000C767599|nr:nitroreductase family protein [Dysgonomonas massiliensis]